MIWWRLFWWMFWRVALSGALCGAAFGTLLLPLLGTIFGFVYGGILGVIVGIISGVAEVLLIRFKFNPPTVTKAFQRWAVGVGVVSAAVVSLVVMNGWFSNVSWFVVVTALIAAVAAGYFAWNYPIHAARLYGQKDIVDDDTLRERKSPIVW